MKPRPSRRITYRFTPVPKVFLEQWLPHLNETELKVYLYLLHRTMGFAKRKDAVAVEQIAAGMVDTNGRRYDSGTGYTIRTVQKALRKLEGRGLILTIKRRNRPNIYEANPAWKDLDLPRPAGQGKTTSTPSDGTGRTPSSGTPTREYKKQRDRFPNPPEPSPTLQ